MQNILEELQLERPKFLFRNLVRTDGYAVDLLFARSLSTESELPDLEARDFDEIELRNHFNLWGLDPMITHIFVAVMIVGQTLTKYVDIRLQNLSPWLDIQRRTPEFES